MGALDRLNFGLAYKRVRDELDDQHRSARAFVANPFERELVELDLDGWLEALRQSVLDRSYSPGAIELCGAPKGKNLVRPGVRMSLADRVVYTAAVGACVKHIVTATKWSQRRIDFSPLFHATRWWQRRWLLNPFMGWEAWTTQSLGKLDLARTKFVVTADIAGYFENISLWRLRSELTRIGCPAEVVELLSRLLLQWAVVRDRGLPQGILASDVLAKLYLESFDKRLKDAGYRHCRYADDVRVFCRTRNESRRVLVLVTELLRERGLTVQSAKTGIRPADDDLRREFAGALPVIRDLYRDYVTEAMDSGLLPEDEASIPASAIDELVNAEPDAMDPEVFHRAFEKFVTGAPSPNPSMFRFLLRRFAALKDARAVDYCAKRLRLAPESTPEILRYFADLNEPRTLEVHVRKALSSNALAMYPYTRVLLLKWLREHGSSRVPTLKAVRRQAFGSEPGYVQAEARGVLGKIGDDSDLDQMAVLLASSHDPLERAQLLCCLARLEKERRGSLAGRLKVEEPWGALATKLIKQTPKS